MRRTAGSKRGELAPRPPPLGRDGIPIDEKYRGYPSEWFSLGEPDGVCGACGRPRSLYRPCYRCTTAKGRAAAARNAERARSPASGGTGHAVVRASGGTGHDVVRASAGTGHGVVRASSAGARSALRLGRSTASGGTERRTSATGRSRAPAGGGRAQGACGSGDPVQSAAPCVKGDYLRCPGCGWLPTPGKPGNAQYTEAVAHWRTCQGRKPPKLSDKWHRPDKLSATSVDAVARPGPSLASAA